MKAEQNTSSRGYVEQKKECGLFVVPLFGPSSSSDEKAQGTSIIRDVGCLYGVTSKQPNTDDPTEQKDDFVPIFGRTLGMDGGRATSDSRINRALIPSSHTPIVVSAQTEYEAVEGGMNGKGFIPTLLNQLEQNETSEHGAISETKGIVKKLQQNVKTGLLKRQKQVQPETKLQMPSMSRLVPHHEPSSTPTSADDSVVYMTVSVVGDIVWLCVLLERSINCRFYSKTLGRALRSHLASKSPAEADHLLIHHSDTFFLDEIPPHYPFLPLTLREFSTPVTLSQLKHESQIEEQPRRMKGAKDKMEKEIPTTLFIVEDDTKQPLTPLYNPNVFVVRYLKKWRRPDKREQHEHAGPSAAGSLPTFSSAVAGNTSPLSAGRSLSFPERRFSSTVGLIRSFQSSRLNPGSPSFVPRAVASASPPESAVLPTPPALPLSPPTDVRCDESDGCAGWEGNEDDLALPSSIHIPGLTQNTTSFSSFVPRWHSARSTSPPLILPSTPLFLSTRC
ncbi:hypothetical protein BLNAU_10608 [Blattamonas nauphoetae]|uniref:Uncharacterized protein n=1 Tax=Blattamonas nauphoetae TaxID=2049346 RepID=A0ABQ9XRS7_9EUKA|nr:hypothetical protein BLNAU_10608 [Blattamonas nauphoetae]